MRPASFNVLWILPFLAICGVFYQMTRPDPTSRYAGGPPVLQEELNLAGDDSTFLEGKKLAEQGNFADAAKRFRAVVNNVAAEPDLVVQAMQQLNFCRQRLGDQNGVDDDLSIAFELHGTHYQVLTEAANQLASSIHYGVVADQKFSRGYQRGYAGRGGVAGTNVSVQLQDWLQELQLRRKAIDAAVEEGLEEADEQLCQLHLNMARTILNMRSGNTAWALQSRTDLTVEPDYTAVDGDPWLPSQNAPVDEAGEPVFYAVPESWDAAKSDGERLRWSLEKAGVNDVVKWDAAMTWAGFLQSQFAVTTLQQDLWLFRNRGGDDGDADTGVFAIHTLADNETIAKLATGAKRFLLPEGQDFVAILKSVEDGATGSSNGENASWQLANIYLNRRQYATAAAQIQKHLEAYPERGSYKPKQQLLEQILEPRVQFDPLPAQLAGEKAMLSLLYRNATELRFTASKVDLEKILAETKSYFRSFPGSQERGFGGNKGSGPPNLVMPTNLFDGSKIEGYTLGEAASWTEKVIPRANHWDKRIELESPLTEAGLYVIDCVANDGNDATHQSRCMVWIQDGILVYKPVEKESRFHFVDAKTGQGIGGANLEFFGYKNDRGANGANRLVTSNIAKATDASGVSLVELDRDYSWFTVARGRDGKRALLGFNRFWRSVYQKQDYLAFKAYGVSDRPVYRPGDTVKAKFWLARPAYGDVEAVRVANEPIVITMLDGQRNKVLEKSLSTDEFGGCEFEYELPDSAMLGYYQFMVSAQNGRRGFQTGLRVRVEEYRKPEFEVAILAPNKPVALGETVEARVQAKYYFGSPVTDAKVTVKVERSTYQDSYFPYAPYDWCYGPGYWWFGNEYDWYPGFQSWRSCIAPSPRWMSGGGFAGGMGGRGFPGRGFPGRWGMDPPELVLEQQLELDSTGEAIVEIDTALAKLIYGDEDHRYTISAEVRDASRRTITAQGSVIAAREAFKIYSWTHRGYYRVGQDIVADFQAQMLDGTPVQAEGTLDLLRISYDENQLPVETSVVSMTATTDASGHLTQKLSADEAGQYRLRLRLTDSEGHRVEGGYVFTVRGGGIDGDDFRYNALELTPDKPSYQPGETVRLQIAANRDDAVVTLFIRPSNGVYLEPQTIVLDAKSSVVEIPVRAEDQPNFFVEAYTVYDGEFHQEVREIIVPPENRVLDVEVTTSKTEYLPGEEASVELVVRDPEGNPVSGSCVLAVYDRSLEQIASDVLPEDIRAFFWKWQRNHNPSAITNAGQYGYMINVSGTQGWQFLGAFGQTLADDADAMVDELRNFSGPGSTLSLQSRRSGGRGMGGGYGGGMGGGTDMFMMEAEGLGAPMPAAMAADGAVASSARGGIMMKGSGGGAGMGQAAAPAPAVRKDFADSALWLVNVETDANGKATANFKMPENLTSWKVRSWAVSNDLQVGSAVTEAVTKKPLLVRLQTPRFLVERDQIVISSIVNNDTREDMQVDVSLEIDGETQIEFAPGVEVLQTVAVKAGEQTRVDWLLVAKAEGTVTLRTIAQSLTASDAMQLEVPIIVNGILKTESWAGTVRNGKPNSVVKLTIPSERRVEQSKLTVRMSPSLAGSMIDALPYLAEYPYGCTEQTLNRFLPTVITQKILQSMEIDLKTLADKRRSNLNAQELGDAQARKERWKRFDREAVFDEELVDDMVETGVQRLTDMQLSDGGWGWFSGAREYSSAHTTATVVRGLLIAQQNGVPIVPDVIARGVEWLNQHQEVELQKLKNAESKTDPYKTSVSNVDALVFHVLVLADRPSEEMQKFLFEKRASLSVYGKALVAWATHKLGNGEQTNMLRQNIEQFLVEDAENETAFLDDNSSWWYWYGSEIEATAIYLKLLAAMEPEGVTAPRLIKYLLNNRKHATYWNSTRDTALVIEAFSDYLRATNELAANMNVEVYLSGKRLGQVEFTPENLFSVNNTIELSGNAVPAGEHELEIRRVGEGNLYWNAYATNFTLEEEIEAAGLEVKIERRYYRVDPTQKDLLLPGDRGSAVETTRSSAQRVALEDLDALPSGSLVEVELLVQSKNDYEYLVIEDRKAASLEAVETQSGYIYTAGLLIYRELRDQHVALCIRNLPKGNYSIRYQLRSEAPGVFTALPATIQGMYAPELVGNSRDFDLKIVDE